MYESFFALQQRPFAAAPLVGRYVPTASMEQARHTVARCIERAEGPALVIGAAGSGKTLLCYLLAEQFRRQYQPVLLFSGHLSTRRDLLQAILFELDLPYRGLEEGELRLTLIDYLTRSPKCPEGILLLVDEAHTLPLKLLEELRMITNVVRNGQPRVRLCLFGGPSLEERLASPRLESFSQRLAARCYLEPFSRDETAYYVRTQIQLAGGETDRIFSPEAIAAVYKATDGIPRLINQVCDHALLMSAQTRRQPVDTATVEQAWADLQQLPAPWTETAADRAAAQQTVVEYGDLDEDESWAEPTFQPQHEESALAPPLEMPAEESPRSEFDSCLELDSYATDDYLQALQQNLQSLEQQLQQWHNGGGPEVELVFDAPAEEPSEQFEINLSLPGSSSVQEPQWHSTEFCEPPDAAAEPVEASPQSTLEWEEPIVSEHQIIEEVVVDRYARLDALKKQGKLPAPPVAGHADAPAAIASSTVPAERSLTLAEALVQHAAAMEQAGWSGPLPEAHTSEVAGSMMPAQAWSTLDLGTGEAPCQEAELAGLTAQVPQADNAAAAEEHECLPFERCPTSPAGQEEPQLIVIEDDAYLPTPMQPQAKPVKRGEYRQLFARLRRS